jgi:photosystem II stability/assembly factor-like uncharacterized protein
MSHRIFSGVGRGSAALLIVLAAGCGSEADAPRDISPDPGVIHVHGLGRNPADGAVVIATHTGLFRVATEGGKPVRVADRYQDTMGFTVVGPDHFLGSGHPGSTRDDPPFLGLIESTDAGNEWRPVSLRGKADFHVLESSDRTVYGFGTDWDSRESRFLRSDDRGRTWTRLEPPEPLLGLAIDPRDSRQIVALGEQRGYVSRDGGATWRPLDLPGGLVTWTEELGVVAVDLEGTVRQADAPDGGWSTVGRVPGTPAALEGVAAELLAATHESRVLSSEDGGRTWRSVVDG